MFLFFSHEGAYCRWTPNPNSEIPFEDQTKLRLTEWFESYGANVYWEKEESYGRTTFASLQTAEKPDLLVKHTDWPTVAYEVKIGNDGTAIYDGAIQTVRYWRRFERGHEEYTVNGTIYQPDVFALATGNAQFGRLYDDARVKDKFKFDLFTSSGRKKGARHGQVPKHEYASSETTLRPCGDSWNSMPLTRIYLQEVALVPCIQTGSTNRQRISSSRAQHMIQVFATSAQQ
ncbi:hypothetical protein ACFQJD_19285 [Haloplanus sp. GCM10025708]|uniref:hypothetical protein n=1 Tax=Haloplanus sp. GCM10025708 TaxID=3252679 RepID=UPI00362238B2